MSDASTATPAADKTESKSSGAKSSGANSSGESTKATTSSETSTSPKSARDSVGGKTEVHYGYFSNVKTPEYRSGWDSIWGGDKDGERQNADRKNGSTARRARPKAPVRVTLSFDDLPETVRDELRKAAARALKANARLDLARREKAGAVDWSIACEVRR